ncbi:hypothetical protein BD413DRAFT_611956 [Trametes elegans]|nr:hypothetical protein BD413DRAFT_611956 [Trametes elegans]
MLPSFSRLFLLAVLAGPVLAAHIGTAGPLSSQTPTRVVRTVPDPASPSTGSGWQSINPTDIVPRPLAIRPANARPLTNAQRLARGLPPRSPLHSTHAHHRGPARRQRAHAPRQSATPCAVSQETGTIRVAPPGLPPKGYVARAPRNGFGEYTLTGQEGDALVVVLLRCDAGSEPFEIRTLNGIADYTLFGGVVGYGSSDDDLAPGSLNYAYLAATISVPPGPAQPGDNSHSAASTTPRDVESALWTLGADRALVPHWVNADGRTARAVHVVDVARADALALTGDVAAFAAAYGPAAELVFEFVPSGGGGP